MRRCEAGSEVAWHDLVDRYHGLAYAVARRLGLAPSDAEDVVQMTFANLAAGVGTLRDPDRVRGWIATAAHRAALRTKRRLRPQSPEPLEELGDPSELPSEELERLQDRALVQRALTGISPRCRTLLTLLFYPSDGAAGGEASYESVARRLGMPVGSVGPTRIRCLQKLWLEFRKITEEHGPRGNDDPS